MLWWARTGKLMQFAAGLAVVIDLIGPDRLRAVGARANQFRSNAVQKIRQASSENAQQDGGAAFATFSAFATIVGLVIAVAAWAFPTAPRPAPESSTAIPSPPRSTGWMADPVATIFSVPLTLVTLYLMVLYRKQFFQLAKLALAGSVGLVADIFMRPPAFLLDNANPAHLVRWLSLLLFCFGFMLDLLGS